MVIVLGIESIAHTFGIVKDGIIKYLFSSKYKDEK